MTHLPPERECVQRRRLWLFMTPAPWARRGELGPRVNRQAARVARRTRCQHGSRTGPFCLGKRCQGWGRTPSPAPASRDARCRSRALLLESGGNNQNPKAVNPGRGGRGGQTVRHRDLGNRTGGNRRLGLGASPTSHTASGVIRAPRASSERRVPPPACVHRGEAGGLLGCGCATRKSP